jgi:hypothetical protein
MPKFTMEIDMGNAAFDESPIGELERILRNLCDRLQEGEFEGSVWDHNGNNVGDFGIKGMED